MIDAVDEDETRTLGFGRAQALEPGERQFVDRARRAGERNTQDRRDVGVLPRFVAGGGEPRRVEASDGVAAQRRQPLGFRRGLFPSRVPGGEKAVLFFCEQGLHPIEPSDALAIDAPCSRTDS